MGRSQHYPKWLPLPHKQKIFISTNFHSFSLLSMSLQLANHAELKTIIMLMKATTHLYGNWANNKCDCNKKKHYILCFRHHEKPKAFNGVNAAIYKQSKETDRTSCTWVTVIEIILFIPIFQQMWLIYGLFLLHRKDLKNILIHEFRFSM